MFVSKMTLDVRDFPKFPEFSEFPEKSPKVPENPRYEFYTSPKLWTQTDIWIVQRVLKSRGGDKQTD